MRREEGLGKNSTLAIVRENLPGKGWDKWMFDWSGGRRKKKNKNLVLTEKSNSNSDEQKEVEGGFLFYDKDWLRNLEHDILLSAKYFHSVTAQAADCG